MRIIADKGVAMVVMDWQDYSNKAHQLLADSNTYKSLHKNPTNKLKNKFAQTLRDIKWEGGLSNSFKYKRLFPISAVPLSSMVYIKYTRLAPPPGPLSPVGVPSSMERPRNWSTSWQSHHHLKKYTTVCEHIKKVKLEPREVMASYDVKALFTSVWMDPSITLVQCKHQWDPLLSHRTFMPILQIVILLEFCLIRHCSSSGVCIINMSMG